MDWFAMIFTIAGVWLLGSQKASGFVFGMIGNVLWVGFALNTGQLRILGLNVLFFALNIRGLWNWTTPKPTPQPHPDPTPGD